MHQQKIKISKPDTKINKTSPQQTQNQISLMIQGQGRGQKKVLEQKQHSNQKINDIREHWNQARFQITKQEKISRISNCQQILKNAEYHLDIVQLILAENKNKSEMVVHMQLVKDLTNVKQSLKYIQPFQKRWFPIQALIHYLLKYSEVKKELSQHTQRVSFLTQIWKRLKFQCLKGISVIEICSQNDMGRYLEKDNRQIMGLIVSFNFLLHGLLLCFSQPITPKDLLTVITQNENKNESSVKLIQKQLDSVLLDPLSNLKITAKNIKEKVDNKQQMLKCLIQIEKAKKEIRNLPKNHIHEIMAYHHPPQVTKHIFARAGLLIMDYKKSQIIHVTHNMAESYDEWLKKLYQFCKISVLRDVIKIMDHFDVESIRPLTLRILHHLIAKRPDINENIALRCSLFGSKLYKWVNSVYDYLMIKAQLNQYQLEHTEQ